MKGQTPIEIRATIASMIAMKVEHYKQCELMRRAVMCGMTHKEILRLTPYTLANIKRMIEEARTPAYSVDFENRGFAAPHVRR